MNAFFILYTKNCGIPNVLIVIPQKPTKTKQKTTQLKKKYIFWVQNMQKNKKNLLFYVDLGLYTLYTCDKGTLEVSL